MKPDDLVVGTVGRIKKDKGQTYLLEVVKKLMDVYPNVKFVISGDVFQGQDHFSDELKERITDLGLEDSVLLTGFCEDTAELLGSFDIFVSPAIVPEGFGLSILEAMAVGKPVVATALGGPMELVEHNVTGFLTPANDSDGMLRSILKLAEDGNLRNSMGRAGRRRFQQLFARSKFIESFEQLHSGISADEFKEIAFANR